MMLVKPLMFALLAAQPGLPPCQRFPLSPHATVEIGARGADTGYSDVDVEMCHRFALTPAQVRRRFRIYHQTDGSEVHDMYMWLPCWQRGTILERGKREGSLMATTYPDGKWKQLGGPYDDDASGGEDPHWQTLRCR